MKRNEAIDLYFRRNIHCNNVIEKLLLWDESKTIEQNSNDAKFKNYAVAFNFAKRYGLAFKPKKKKVDITSEAIHKLTDNGLTLVEISKLLGVSKQRVHQLRNGL